MLTLKSALLDEIPGVRHAFFTRQGGVSEGVYDSLNVGVGSKDDPEAVQENRARAAAALGGVVAATVEAMVAKGAKRERIVAAIGPCIGQASYEVGEDFMDRFALEAPGSERFFAPGRTPGKRQFDLPGFVLQRLAEAGVARAEWIGRDTCAEENLFFSNRRGFLRGEPDYGRLLSAIVLQP